VSDLDVTEAAPMSPPRRPDAVDLDPKRTAELLDKLAAAVRDSRMLKARVVKAQDAETAPALRRPRRRRTSSR
jgi:hypothetical protein